MPAPTPASISASPAIHPTAVIDPQAELADGVEIGPYAMLTGRVRLGPGVRVMAHAMLAGPLDIGSGTTIYPHATLGLPPQDFKFAPGSPTAGVVVGSDCIIREQSSIHAASNDHTPTRVGNRCFLMVNAHVGHDCRVGNDVIMVNNTALGGHAIVDDRANISGGAAVHQHTRVGRLAMASGGSVITSDIPPFFIHVGRATLAGVNHIGLRRNGFDSDAITQIRRAYRDCFRRPVPKDEMIAMLREQAKTCPPIGELADFVEQSARGVAIGRSTRKQ